MNDIQAETEQLMEFEENFNNPHILVDRKESAC